MYRIHHNDQLSIAEFHVPFGGKFDPDNRLVLLSSLMPWEAPEETYAPQFNPTTGPPAKPVRLAFGPLFIMQRLDLTDEKIVVSLKSPNLIVSPPLPLPFLAWPQSVGLVLGGIFQLCPIGYLAGQAASVYWITIFALTVLTIRQS
jgi:hypothetical protein